VGNIVLSRVDIFQCLLGGARIGECQPAATTSHEPHLRSQIGVLDDHHFMFSGTAQLAGDVLNKRM
jgi:hypothetical protein